MGEPAESRGYSGRRSRLSSGSAFGGIKWLRLPVCLEKPDGTGSIPMPLAKESPGLLLPRKGRCPPFPGIKSGFMPAAHKPAAAQGRLR